MLCTKNVRLGYGETTIVDDLSLAIPDGGFSVIIGPNGCGKSTLLRALARILKPNGGQVLLDGSDIHHLHTRDVARRIGLLPQSPRAPSAITVHELVEQGRYPYQSVWRHGSAEDDRVVVAAMEQVGIAEFATTAVDELSGGQRQRAWIAMALAQQTQYLLLDEPTTFLDIAHQISVLNLCHQLRSQGKTLVVVLHDLNLAARYATHVIAMNNGEVIAEGSPEEVFSPRLVEQIFGLDAHVMPDPTSGRPLIIPKGHRINE